MKKASYSLMTPATFVVMLLSLIATFIVLLGSNPVYSQTTQSEEYNSKHDDGGDREAYEQELAYNDDPEFYVPPVNDTVSLLV